MSSAISTTLQGYLAKSPRLPAETQHINIREARIHLSGITNFVRETKAPVVFTRHGRPSAAMVNIESLLQLETFTLLALLAQLYGAGKLSAGNLGRIGVTAQVLDKIQQGLARLSPVHQAFVTDQVNTLHQQLCQS